MGDSRVPAWYAATGLRGENRRVYESFKNLLHNLPMSYTELAARIGVSQPAVSRWASDVSHPSLDEMSAAYAAVQAHLDEIGTHLERFGEVLRLVEEALRLYRIELERPATDTPEPREVDRQDLADRLRDKLGVISDLPQS